MHSMEFMVLLWSVVPEASELEGNWSAVLKATQLQGDCSTADVASEPEISFVQLGLTDKLLGDGQYGQTLMVRLSSLQYLPVLPSEELVVLSWCKKACL